MHFPGITKDQEFFSNRHYASVLDGLKILQDDSLNSTGSFHIAPAADNSYKWAGGGFVSSAEDLVKFGSTLLQPGFLKPETLDLLFTSQRTSAGEETGYGIGWFLRTDSSGHRWAFHGGGSVGGTAAFGLDRDSRSLTEIVK